MNFKDFICASVLLQTLTVHDPVDVTFTDILPSTFEPAQDERDFTPIEDAD